MSAQPTNWLDGQFGVWFWFGSAPHATLVIHIQHRVMHNSG